MGSPFPCNVGNRFMSATVNNFYSLVPSNLQGNAFRHRHRNGCHLSCRSQWKRRNNSWRRPLHRKSRVNTDDRHNYARLIPQRFCDSAFVTHSTCYYDVLRLQFISTLVEADDDISTTTRDRRRLVPQLLYWKTNNVLVTQLLRRSFQKVRNFTAGIVSKFPFVFFVLTTSGATTAEMSWNFGTDIALDMLVVCLDIHVLGSPPMSVIVTRMQDLASEFSKIFRGWYPRTPTVGGDKPLLTHPSSASGRARGAWDPNLGPAKLFSRGCAPGRWRH